MAIQTKETIQKAVEKKFKHVAIFHKDKNGKKVTQNSKAIFLGTFAAKLTSKESKDLDNFVDTVNWFLKDQGGKQTSGNKMTFAGGDKGNFNVNVVLDWETNEDDQTENYFARVIYK